MAIGPIILDCACLGPEAETIDRIARLHLLIRRSGCRLQLSNVDQALLELVRLCGLSGALGVEPGRQAEEGEEARGVEEEGELGNPPVPDLENL